MAKKKAPQFSSKKLTVDVETMRSVPVLDYVDEIDKAVESLCRSGDAALLAEKIAARMIDRVALESETGDEAAVRIVEAVNAAFGTEYALPKAEKA